MRSMIKDLFRQLYSKVIIYWAQRYRLQKNNAIIKVRNRQWRIIDGSSFYIQYKDIFIRRIYEFETSNPDPVIIDGGSNIGTSILFFRLKYPRAKILGFEPDPEVFSVLSKNIRQLNDSQITLINAGLGKQEGRAFFMPDGNVGGFVSGEREGKFQIDMVQLSSYLKTEIDYVKLNIEGLECEVLQEAEQAGVMRNIKQLAIEYHGWYDGHQALGEILDILDRNHFRYRIHDFDYETCPSTKPPIRFSQKSNWFCMVYATNSSQGMV